MTIGQILTFSYIYSACIPVFYQVVSVKNKSVYLQRMQKHLVDDEDGYGQSGTQAPSFDMPMIGEPELFRVKVDSKGCEYCNIDGHRAYEWDGKPRTYYGD